MTGFRPSIDTQIYILLDEIERLECYLADKTYDEVARYRCDVFKVILRGLTHGRKSNHGEMSS